MITVLYNCTVKLQVSRIERNRLWRDIVWTNLCSWHWLYKTEFVFEYMILHQSVSAWHINLGYLISSSRHPVFKHQLQLARSLKLHMQISLRWIFLASSFLSSTGFALSPVCGHDHVPPSPPTGRSWCCRLWWSGCAWQRFTRSTDAASLWTATMFGRLPASCCPEWTVSRANFGTALKNHCLPPHIKNTSKHIIWTCKLTHQSYAHPPCSV